MWFNYCFRRHTIYILPLKLLCAIVEKKRQPWIGPPLNEFDKRNLITDCIFIIIYEAFGWMISLPLTPRAVAFNSIIKFLRADQEVCATIHLFSIGMSSFWFADNNLLLNPPFTALHTCAHKLLHRIWNSTKLKTFAFYSMQSKKLQSHKMRHFNGLHALTRHDTTRHLNRK